MKKHAAPIITAVLLLLPILYVGSYLALVNPRPDGANYGWRYSNVPVTVFFWPLEQIDRKIRPNLNW